VEEREHSKEILQKRCRNIGCAKGFVNGPCGGFVDGKCETDYTKNCVWVSIYKRFRTIEAVEKFVNRYVAPKK
jgi:hypothetical protein